jgi:hypothetical protein
MAEIRNAEKGDIKALVKIYKEFFPKHNIFSDEKYSTDYIEDNLGEFIVILYVDDVVGGLRIVEKKETKDHSLINFKHIASKNKDKEILAELIKAAEDLVGPGKIELHIADSEIPNRYFFEKLGYVLEGTLTNHYRKAEKCYVLGKYVGE